MAAGVIDRPWGMGDLFDAVTEHAAQVKAKAARDRRIQWLIDRLRRGEKQARRENCRRAQQRAQAADALWLALLAVEWFVYLFTGM